jgi:hypothetical protein
VTATTDMPADLEFVDPADLTWQEIARFWSKVNVRSVNQCWEWRDRPNVESGYGSFFLRARPIGAHRVACAIAHGPADGHQALHSCDNPICVNPNHLRWGTMAENVEDRCRRGRSAQGSRAGLSRLTETEVLEIRRRVAAGEQQAALARRFGVTKQNIRLIVARRTWRHV